MHKVRVCFEIAGMAEDDQGHPAPAGMEVCMGESLKEYPYEKLTKGIDYDAIANLLHVDRKDITVITPEEYDERYGGKE